MAIRIVEEICLITEDGERIEVVCVESEIDQSTMRSPSHQLEYKRYFREKGRTHRSREIVKISKNEFLIDGRIRAYCVQWVG